MPKIRAETIDDYIAKAPAPAQPHLRAIRAILRKAAPKATEAIKWGNPVWEEGRILFAIAAYKTHLNFMPTPSVVKAFAKELAGYTTGSSSVQFPDDAPLPKALIAKLARRRVRELRENDARWM